MTKEFYTLAELIKMRKGIEDYGKIFDSIKFNTPLLDVIPSRVIGEKTEMTELVTISYPMPGAVPFNAGMTMDKSEYETRTHSTYPYADICKIDAKFVHAMPTQAGVMMRKEMKNKLQGFKANMERTLFYGSLVSAVGSKGLMDLMGDYMTISADNAHNSTATRTDGGMSVWLLCIDEDNINVNYTGSSALSYGPEQRGMLPALTVDGKEGLMDAVYRSFNVTCGLALLNTGAAMRLVNVSADHPVTDSLIDTMIDSMPNGLKPTHIFMNRKARAILQAQRTAGFKYVKKTSGSTISADIPAEHNGLPILVTDGLLNDETDAALAALKDNDRVRLEKGQTAIKR